MLQVNVQRIKKCQKKYKKTGFKHILIEFHNLIETRFFYKTRKLSYFFLTYDVSCSVNIQGTEIVLFFI